jgi:hypothetical protein
MQQIAIQDTLPKLTGEVTLEFRNVKTGKVRRYVERNMVVTLAKNAIAQRLTGNDSAAVITYCALGTGITAPALADTQLQTEIERKLVSVRSVSGNIATFQTFFNISEGNGTLREAGLFGDASGVTASDTVDSGQLYCRVAINRTKTSNDTLSLSWVLTIG